MDRVAEGTLREADVALTPPPVGLSVGFIQWMQQQLASKKGHVRRVVESPQASWLEASLVLLFAGASAAGSAAVVGKMTKRSVALDKGDSDTASMLNVGICA